MNKFEISGDQFLLNGKEYKLISGGMHYFRVPREYWRDRLEKLLLMGCNTVETYLPWNLHEPHPGHFDFSGMLDFESFVHLAEELGLNVILRPSPYICGEFEFGGLPWWLLKDRTMRVRSLHDSYLSAVSRYYDELIPRIASLQIHKGGPVLALQIENEYGYYGNNKSYLNFLRDGLLSRGIEIPLFTSDGPWGDHLISGQVEGALSTANFGSGAPGHFAKLRKFQPGKPLVCMEFWMGWFDAWGDEHHTRDPEDAANSLREILEEGHINFYMFHGGTNFGFTSGANYYEGYKPDVTSYDYDAPLSESGETNKKYSAFRREIANFQEIPAIKTSSTIEKLVPEDLPLTGRLSLFDLMEERGPNEIMDRAVTMEDLDQGYGYINYRISVTGTDKETLLDLSHCSDRVIVYLDGSSVAIRERDEMSRPVKLDIDEKAHRVDLLVENQGRVNFGHKMNRERKGFNGPILVNGCEIGPVHHYCLPLEKVPGFSMNVKLNSGDPGFHLFKMHHNPEKDVFYDSFINMEGWGKGSVFINGFNLGRYWQKGPQKTLYLAGAFLKEGENEIVVFETEGISCEILKITDTPHLG